MACVAEDPVTQSYASDVKNRTVGYNKYKLK